jgi:tetratricopeptide (TPR) repeat protein
MIGWKCCLRRGLSLTLALFSLSSLTLTASDDSVRVWTEPLVIPTYLVGPPDENPIFYTGRAYQGAQGPVYPYPFLDVLTDKLAERTYTALYLENALTKICVLPEIGGRIFEAVDKTNGHNFFYRQHVIKPALIGMLGAWISGGVEWNIPHHHRATSFLPVDWTLAADPDGSKTIWVGELELRHRMKWLVGLTLRPGRSALEITYKIINRTPFVHSILCWANAAVHANETYQVIFPPGTSLATFHGKNQFSHWPVSRELYNRVDYSKGVDVSWWKNNPSPTSFFAWESEEDFFAGYDHGRDAGIVFVGDHHFVPGKKFWTWGTGEEGKRWQKILTDADGPYLELMFGAFSDNQPDYSWCQPYGVKTVTQTWFPVRRLGGVKMANAEAACNLELRSDGRAFVGINTTSLHLGAKITLSAGKRILFEEKTDLGPEQPFSEDIPVPPGLEEESLCLSLHASGGQEIIRYQPQKSRSCPIPKPVAPPLPPREIGTNEELYLAGLRLEQFYNPVLEPFPYYEEALRRDPNDARTNTALGRLYLQRGLYGEAQACLERAVARLTGKYTRPKEGEALYYLGLALRAAGRHRQAFDALARASWSEAWAAASYCQMAELASCRGDFSEALSWVDRSLALNRWNEVALNLRAVLLRKTGRAEEARNQAEACLTLNPLDTWAANELSLLGGARGFVSDTPETPGILAGSTSSSVQNFLELAADYVHAGLWDEAIHVLSRGAGSGAKQGPAHPLVYYYLGYCSHQKGDDEKAGQFSLKASELAADYVFPFRLESMDVLEWAEQENPRDARALYYLGNLLYERQPERAIAEWEKSRSRDNTFPTTHRNLGLAYARVRDDLPAALASLEKAVACDPDDPRLYLELDQLSELAGVSPQSRLDRLIRNHAAVAKRDDAVAREIALLVELGRYDRAFPLLTFRHFHVWEGGGEIHDIYVNACLLRGQKYMAGKRYRQALNDFKAALEYPDNLEVGRPAQPRRFAEIYYFIGRASESMGRVGEARQAFTRATSPAVGPSELSYYQGLSWRRLGDEAKAAELFDELVRFAHENVSRSGSGDFFAKFGEEESAERRQARFHYLAGLGLRGLRDKPGAEEEFKKALALHPHDFRARRQLGSLE